MQLVSDPSTRPLTPTNRAEAKEHARRTQAAHSAFWAQAEGQRVRITRVITYEGDAEWLLDQLGMSLPEGVRRVGPRGSCSIQVVAGEPEIVR